jgi:hypothetical protein
MANMCRRDAPTKYRNIHRQAPEKKISRDARKKFREKYRAKCLFEARQNVDKIHRSGAPKNMERCVEKNIEKNVCERTDIMPPFRCPKKYGEMRGKKYKEK